MSNTHRGSTDADKHPYLRNCKYHELFGHLYQETSSPEFRQRMETQYELIRQSKRSFSNPRLNK